MMSCSLENRFDNAVPIKIKRIFAHIVKYKTLPSCTRSGNFSIGAGISDTHNVPFSSGSLPIELSFFIHESGEIDDIFFFNDIIYRVFLLFFFILNIIEQ
ncbi:hypothetical protein SDC9_89124 [bioreactor metagenome]|uniref:Uncharacterized protein n=1 Tax=bioreactor metagenome TaxID=1076179 RepID=A0A644ZND3_9ZZZZ